MAPARFPMHAEAPPPPQLAPFVEAYWHVWAEAGQAPGEPDIQKVLPDGGIILMFNLGAPHRLYDPADLSRWTLSKRCWLSGFQSGYLVIGPTQGTHMMGVRFRPGGVFPFFNIPLSEFSQRVIEMDEVWGLEGDRVCQQLAETTSLAGRFDVLSRFLLGRARGRLLLERRVDYCLEQFIDDPQTPLNEIVSTLGLSGKHLNRIFRKHVGTNPKTVQRVHRFQQAIRVLEETGSEKWIDLALESGYYDQAHFIGDFKRFTGVTPTQYLKKRTPYLNFIDAV